MLLLATNMFLTNFFKLKFKMCTRTNDKSIILHLNYTVIAIVFDHRKSVTSIENAFKIIIHTPYSVNMKINYYIYV